MIDMTGSIFIPGAELRQRLYAICQEIGCSTNEAIGAIVSLWLFAAGMDNDAGVPSFPIEVLRPAVKSTLSARYNPDMMLTAMIKAGVIKERRGAYVIADYEAVIESAERLEEFDMKLEKKRRLDMLRKQRRRAELKEAEQKAPPPEPAPPPPKSEQITLIPEEPSVQEPVEPKKPKAKKKAYAELVHMTEDQYQKLVDQYGQEVADEAVKMLDNYKGSKGKTYKDDYRAILNWVIDRVKEKRPDLFRSANKVEWHDDNPF